MCFFQTIEGESEKLAAGAGTAGTEASPENPAEKRTRVDVDSIQETAHVVGLLFLTLLLPSSLPRDVFVFLSHLFFFFIFRFWKSLVLRW